MTSKVENHDSPSSATSTNQKRRHSRSKVVTSEVDSKRIKDDLQHHVMTNGHDSRRHSSDSNSKHPSDNNKENAHGQNSKEDSCPEKKKKKRKKKKKGGGGGNSGGNGGGTSEPATTTATTGKGNSHENRSDCGTSQSTGNEEDLESPRSKGKLTHTSSEEHSDDTPSTHVEEVCYVESQSNHQEAAQTCSTHEVTHNKEADDSLEREPIDCPIDQVADRINTVSTSINNSSNNAVETDHDGACTESKVGVDDVNIATISSEKCGEIGYVNTALSYSEDCEEHEDVKNVTNSREEFEENGDVNNAVNSIENWDKNRDDVNNEFDSNEKCVCNDLASFEQDVMPHKDRRRSRTSYTENVSVDEGSSVDEASSKNPSHYQETDLFIQEASDFPRNGFDKSNYADGNSEFTNENYVEYTTRQCTADRLKDPLQTEIPASPSPKTSECSVSEKAPGGLNNSSEIGNDDSSSDTNSEEVAILSSKQGEDNSQQIISSGSTKEDNSNEVRPEKAERKDMPKLENLVEPDLDLSHTQVMHNSEQPGVENCLSKHVNLTPSVSNENRANFPKSDASESNDTFKMVSKDNSTDQVEHQANTRPTKLDISIVDLIGSRATAGSAIRAGIIQDMMLGSGNCDGTSENSKNSDDSSLKGLAGSSSSKLDITESQDDVCNKRNEKISNPMTQQNPEPEETSNVDCPVNGIIDITMEQKKILELQPHESEQEQTQREEVATCDSSSNAVEAPDNKQREAGDESCEEIVPKTHVASTEGKIESAAEDRKCEGVQTHDKHVHLNNAETLDQTADLKLVAKEEQRNEDVFSGNDTQCETDETTNEDIETSEKSTETQEQTTKTADNPIELTTAQVQEKPREILKTRHSSTEWHNEAMTNLQAHAQAQQAKANLMITSLRARLRKRDLELRDVKDGHERQLSAVVTHLLRLEGEMQKEQRQVLEALADRDDIIRRQKTAIDDLTEKNDKLMKTLKESQQYISKMGAPLQNGDLSIRDHGNKVVIRGTKGRSSNRSLKSNSGEFKPNGEKPKVRFTTAVMDRLRRHKSSLELYRPEPMEPLIEGNLRFYSSQDNLVDENDGGNGGEEGRERGEQTDSPKRGDDKTPVMRREGNLQKKQRCRSLVDYPFVGGLEEADEEVGGSSESCYDEGFSSSPVRISRHDSGLSSSMSSLTGSGEVPNWVRRWSAGGGGGGVALNGGIRPRVMSADLAASPTSSSPYSPQSPSSPNFFPNSSKTKTSSSTPSPTSSPSPYGFTELSTKSRSVPHALPTVSENDTCVGVNHSGVDTASKERPHSLTTVELMNGNLSRSNSTNSTSTPNLVPAGSAVTSAPVSGSPPSSSSLPSSSESNPFKSFKNVFKRRGSKKKRSVALNQPGNQEHSETVKNYFKKHDLT